MTATFESPNYDRRIDEAARFFLDYLERKYALRNLTENYGRPIPPIDMTRIHPDKKNAVASLLLSVNAMRTFFGDARDDKADGVIYFLNNYYNIEIDWDDFPELDNEVVEEDFYDILIREVIVRKIFDKVNNQSTPLKDIVYLSKVGQGVVTEDLPNREIFGPVYDYFDRSTDVDNKLQIVETMEKMKTEGEYRGFGARMLKLGVYDPEQWSHALYQIRKIDTTEEYTEWRRKNREEKLKSPMNIIEELQEQMEEREGQPIPVPEGEAGRRPPREPAEGEAGRAPPLNPQDPNFVNQVRNAQAGQRAAQPDIYGDNQPPPNAPPRWIDPHGPDGQRGGAAIGQGNRNVPLGNPDDRILFALDQANALNQFNTNQLLKKNAIDTTRPSLPRNKFVSYEEWEGMYRAREMAQMQLHIDQEQRDNMIMRMNQMEEQARNKGWYDYHYGKELA